jgi:hypothetical protein
VFVDEIEVGESVREMCISEKKVLKYILKTDWVCGVDFYGSD